MFKFGGNDSRQNCNLKSLFFRGKNDKEGKWKRENDRGYYGISVVIAIIAIVILTSMINTTSISNIWMTINQLQLFIYVILCKICLIVFLRILIINYILNWLLILSLIKYNNQYFLMQLKLMNKCKNLMLYLFQTYCVFSKIYLMTILSIWWDSFNSVNKSEFVARSMLLFKKIYWVTKNWYLIFAFAYGQNYSKYKFFPALHEYSSCETQITSIGCPLSETTSSES